MTLKDKIYRASAWALMAVCVVGWPTSLMWWLKDEPPGILSLSWAALFYSAYVAVMTADIKKDQDDD